LIGCGAIGGEVVRMLSALGAQVLAYDPMQPDLRIGADRFTWVDLATALHDADIITFHCPLQKNGKPILDAAAIAALRPSVIIVNTARAALVDEVALLAGLTSGAIESYATDVFEQEPPKDLTLARHPRVIATSHIGGFTDESVERATSVAIDHLLAALRPMAKAHVG
jgi:D-3-phosphoglycerate dehydrogenase